MNFAEYLDNHDKRVSERKMKEEMERKKVAIYNDIAYFLWYVLLYDDILKNKRSDMDCQQTPFRIYDWGQYHMKFGPVVALTKADDIEAFEKRAKALLKDKGLGNFKVRVYPDCISLVVSR